MSVNTFLHAFLLLLCFAGHSPQIISFFLALTSTALLFLLFFLMLRFSVVKRGRKKLLYIFKQRKISIIILQLWQGKAFYNRKENMIFKKILEMRFI